MAINIKSPSNSFIQFDNDISETHPIWGDISACLPVYDEDDVAFQFVLEGDTEAEIDALAAIGNTDVVVGLADIQGVNIMIFLEQPERFRISPKQILYNWIAGFPAFQSQIEIGQCFVVQITVNGEQFESNCFQRIPSDDFTSVLEFGNEDNSFGFNYCASGVIDPDEIATCEPTQITFTNESNLTIPYTASLKDAYGDTPTVQVWLFNEEGDLINAGIEATLDGFPPNNLIFDFGGNASGLILIK